MAKTPSPKKRKEKKNVYKGKIFIQSTFNNTIVTATDTDGNALAQGSSGSIGFKGSKKGTPFAAQLAAESVARTVLDMGMRQVDVMVKGPGPGRETAIRVLQATGLDVQVIRDVTPIPHNGCRPPKKRRI